MLRLYAVLWHAEYGQAASEVVYADASTHENALARLRKWEAQRQCGSDACACRDGMAIVDAIPTGIRGMLFGGAQEVTGNSGETD